MAKYKWKFNPRENIWQYVLDETSLLNLDWQDSVKDRDLATPPESPTAGDRYIVAVSGTGDWDGLDGYVVEYNGDTSSWDSVVPNEGMACEVEDENKIYIYTTSWVTFDSLITHNNLATIQGGTSTEYYHLTSSEHTELTEWLDDVTLSNGGSVDLGSGTLSAGGPWTLTQNSHTIVFSHNGSNVFSKWTSDGNFIFQTDEGTNTASVVQIQGKGSGTASLRLVDQSAVNQDTYIQQVGSVFRTFYSAGVTEFAINEGGLAVDTRIESNNNANMLFVDGTNDRIGIGTSTPDDIFNIVTAGTNATHYEYHDSYSDQYHTELAIRRTANNTEGSFTTTTSGANLGIVRFYGSSNSAFIQSAIITAKQDGIVSTYVPTNLIFETYNDTSLNSNQLVLHNDGFIGIGTDAPNSKLDVEGNIYPHTDDTYYLGKNDDDTPFAWKGVILKDTTNGKYYRIEIINGSVTATDLTD